MLLQLHVLTAGFSLLIGIGAMSVLIWLAVGIRKGRLPRG